MILTSLFRSPSALPPWREPEWRAALRYRDSGPRPSHVTIARGQVRDAVLSDPALGDLVRWAANRRPLSYQLGAIAAALGAVGESHTAGEADVLADRVIAAVDQARMLQYEPVADRAMLTDCSEITDAPPGIDQNRPSLVSLVLPYLLDKAGCRLSSQPVLAGRIEAAVDVCLAAWLHGCEAGGGLPEFSRAESRNHKHRVSSLLGADRDLQRLVEAQHPVAADRCRTLAVAASPTGWHWLCAPRPPAAPSPPSRPK